MDYIGRGYCPNCEENVDVVMGDWSFDHAFGTHKDFRPACSECGDEMEDFDPVPSDHYYSMWDNDERV